MRKFLVLYQSEGALSGVSVSEMFARSTPEQMKAGMAAWRTWHENNAAAVIDLGAPLDNSTTVTVASAVPSKTSITGYSFLQAVSIDDAISRIEQHPHFHMPGSSVQILECISMPGM